MYENYEFICTKDLSEIDINDNNIYYLYDYYKKWWIEHYPDNNFYRTSYFSFIKLKKGEHNPNWHFKFVTAVNNFLNMFNGEWIICSIPGHEKTLNITNALHSQILSKVYLEPGQTMQNTLIQRSYTVDKKSMSANERVKDYKIEMKSLLINDKINIKNKNIIVFDDITTTGCSMIAAKELLLEAGAKNVVCVALGKTKEPKYGY